MLLYFFVLSLVLAACSTSSAITSVTSSSSTTPAVKSGYTSYKAAGCLKDQLSGGLISQSMNGSVSGCIRVGALKPGNYTVSLTGVEINKGAAAAAKATSSVSGSTSVGPRVSMTLSPSSGRPGTIVSVSGKLSSPLPRQPGHANLCWDGCVGGLSYSGVTLHWLSSTKFTTSLTVPSAPWFLQGSDKVAKLNTGNYRISVECLSYIKGCGLRSSEGSATFHLVDNSVVKWCASTPSCASLKATSRVYLPGDIVKVAGFAPLQSIIGSHSPFVFELSIRSGSPVKDAIEFNKPNDNAKGGVSLVIGQAPITVVGAPSFASLGRVAPGQAIQAGASPISGNPANPGQVLWCYGSKVGFSDPSGTNWIDTSGATSMLKSAGYGLLGSTSPRCDSVALADGGTPGKIFAVSFTVAPDDQSPPFANVAMTTADKGKTWNFVPVPTGSTMDSFAGFRYRASSLQALFAPESTNGKSSEPNSLGVPLVETLGNGSSTWHSGSFTCPSAGPCVTFGSYLAGNCAMNGSVQQIFRSSDNGREWSKPNWPTIVNGCWSADLVPISKNFELQINTGTQFYLLESKNGGKDWFVVSLPDLPGVSSSNSGMAGSSAGLNLLPNGSILLTGSRGNTYTWDLLPPKAKNWCAVKGLQNGTQSSAKFSKTYLIGNDIYWIDQRKSNTLPSLMSVAVNQIKC